MKKDIYFLLLLIPMFFASCSEDLDYRAALRENDFEKAHAILNKMEDKLNDFYENNEMREEKWDGTGDYTNLHTFEKMCQNQIDAICTVFGEEMKYVASMNEPDVKTRLTYLFNDAQKDAERITNKLSKESGDAASDLRWSFKDNMRSVVSVIETILDEPNEWKQQNIDFMAATAKKDGILSLGDGIYYTVEIEGKGAVPTASSLVKFNYECSLIDGTSIDSSYKLNKPLTTSPTQVIAGLSKALTSMPVGSKWKVYIPQEQGYGSHEMGSIKPFSALIFTIELLSIEK